MRPGHIEEGVELRGSLPLPHHLPDSLRTEAMSSSPSPGQAPRGTLGKVKYYITQTLASFLPSTCRS